MKHERVVQQPNIDQALWMWQMQMQAKGKSTTGPMLMEKQARFEAAMQVPKEERLKGLGWISSWKAT
jgi:hypothetical protein